MALEECSRSIWSWSVRAAAGNRRILGYNKSILAIVPFSAGHGILPEPL